MSAGGRRVCIALVAPSGSGKSTTAGFVLDRCRALGVAAAVVKLAQPLYDVQSCIYRACGVAIEPGAQNQALLETVASLMRAIDARSLVNAFFRALDATDAQVVVNDDLRDPEVDWPALRAAGFRAVRIVASGPVVAQRLARRADLHTQRNSAVDARAGAIEADFTLENHGDSLAEYRRTVDRFVDELLAAHGVRP